MGRRSGMTEEDGNMYLRVETWTWSILEGGNMYFFLYQKAKIYLYCMTFL